MVRNSMVEALWTDCENRAKAIGDLATRLQCAINSNIIQADVFSACGPNTLPRSRSSSRPPCLCTTRASWAATSSLPTPSGEGSFSP